MRPLRYFTTPEELDTYWKVLDWRIQRPHNPFSHLYVHFTNFCNNIQVFFSVSEPFVHITLMYWILQGLLQMSSQQQTGFPWSRKVDWQGHHKAEEQDRSPHSLVLFRVCYRDYIVTRPKLFPVLSTVFLFNIIVFAWLRYLSQHRIRYHPRSLCG